VPSFSLLSNGHFIWLKFGPSFRKIYYKNFLVMAMKLPVPRPVVPSDVSVEHYQVAKKALELYRIAKDSKDVDSSLLRVIYYAGNIGRHNLSQAAKKI
jgi:hypothetical protein